MSAKQEDLRDRLETMISAWCKEWEGCTYDVVGVLTVYCQQLVSDQSNDEASGSGEFE